MKKLVLFLAVTIGLIGAIVAFQAISSEEDTEVLSGKVVPKEPQKILYVSDQTGNQDIYSYDLKTKKRVNLTQNPSQDMNPQVSPGGKYIVFYSDRDGDNEIYRMRLKDGEIMQLTHNNAEDYDPTYSPDGKSIAYKSTADDKKGDIFLMQANGTNEKNLTAVRKNTEEWDPSFTSDGKHILFVIRKNNNPLTDELAIMTTDGNEVRMLTKNAVPDWYPSLHPTKNWLAFVSKTDPTTDDDIFMSTLSGESRTQMTTLAGNDCDPAWNASGSKLVFINDFDGDYDIYTMNADGSNVEKLIDTTADELSPVFL